MTAPNYKEGEGDGPNVIMLSCPICGWYGEAYYTTKAPIYCCNACKQKAHRQRKKAAKTAEPVQLDIHQIGREDQLRLARFLGALADHHRNQSQNTHVEAKTASLHRLTADILRDLSDHYGRLS